MEALLERVRGLGMVARGGTAPAVMHGLSRHMMDLDFDTDRPVELTDHTDSTAQPLEVNLESARQQDR